MSMLLMVKAMQIKVGNPLRKLVLIKLADNASDTGECFPSYQHIADQCEIGRSTVRKHIKALEKDGVLRIENRKGGPKGNYSNVYYLTLDNIKTTVSPDSTPLCHEVAHPVAPDSTPLCHQIAPEPVTLLTSHRTKDKEILSGKPNDASESAPQSSTGKKSKAPKASKYAHHADEIKTVIDHLNQVTDSKFTTCDTNASLISGRLSDGHSVDELIAVIDYKNTEWGRDLKMCQYLRPITLFKPAAFGGYLKQAKIAASGQFDARRTSNDDSDIYDHDDISWAKDLGL